MEIKSSIFSFVDFNDAPDTCSPEVMPLPAVNDFGIKFQFYALDADPLDQFWAVPVINQVPVLTAKVRATTICGVLAKKTLFANVPAVDIHPLLSYYECFQYAIYNADPSTEGAVLIAISNPFQYVPESCWLSKIEYWSEDNFADFTYSDDGSITNTAWLDLYLRNPTNPTKETRYTETTGRKRLLAASIDEDYELITDNYTQYIHRKIEATLVHDYIRFTNSNVGLVDEVLSKSGNYTKEWPSDAPGNNIVQGKCRVVKNLSYTNSNCGNIDCACTTPPIAAPYVLQLYKGEYVTRGAGALFTGAVYEGTLSVLPGTFETANGGSLIINANGSFSYTAPADFVGQDSFTFTLVNECGTGTASLIFNLKNMEPGIILDFGSTADKVPDGFLPCDGAAVSRTTYAALFDVIGTLWGPGNGTTTFNLPNYKKKGSVGFDASTAGYDVIGASLGNASATLTDQQIKHDHYIFADATGADGTDKVSDYPERPPVANTNDDTNTSYLMVTLSTEAVANAGKTSPVGNSGDPRAAVDLRNPDNVVLKIIKY